MSTTRIELFVAPEAYEANVALARYLETAFCTTPTSAKSA